MISPDQFRTEIVRPVLQGLGLHSDAAENLLMGTAAHESKLVYLRQVGGGPARGLYQIEPATAKDIVGRYIELRPDLKAAVDHALYGLLPADVRWDNDWTPDDDAALEFRLVSDLAFGTVLCRLRYWMVPDPLPAADDIEGLASYWKEHYNTPGGAGTPAQFILDYRQIVEGRQ